MKTLKVFQMNDCDWWADYSKEEAIENYCKFVGISKDEIIEDNDDIGELTSEAMNRLMFQPDPYDEPNAPKRTFQEELDRNIKEGNIKPFFFASTEY